MLGFVPFRTASDSLASIEPPARRDPPSLLGFAAAGDTYRVVYEEGGTVRVVEIDRRNGRVHRVATCAVHGANPLAAVGREHWGVFDAIDGRVQLFADDSKDEARSAPVANGDVLRPFVLEGAACLAISHESRSSTPTRGPRIDVLDARLKTVLTGAWFAPPTARTLLAATSTVFGPATVFATDREDEIDVCASGREGASLQRTVSLVWKQRFECAYGGGSRIMVVSRDTDGITVRTLASDVRSELNPVPIRPRTGWQLGAVKCVYANGPFVVAHSERRDDESIAVTTMFDAGNTQTQRLTLPGVDAIAVDGKDVCVAAMLPAASAPVILLHRSTRMGTHARHYAFFLDEPDTRTPYARHAVLVDLAEILARAMGVRVPTSFELRTFDETADSAHFALPGIDAAHDVAVAVLLREDGSGITSLRIGGGPAPTPRGLHFAEKLREVFTGDDDGDVATTRLEHEHVAHGIESIVSTIGAMRAVHGG